MTTIAKYTRRPPLFHWLSKAPLSTEYVVERPLISGTFPCDFTHPQTAYQTINRFLAEQRVILFILCQYTSVNYKLETDPGDSEWQVGLESE